jgi:hypothetical protein
MTVSPFLLRSLVFFWDLSTRICKTSELNQHWFSLPQGYSRYLQRTLTSLKYHQTEVDSREFLGKVTSQRGTRSSYVAPNKNLAKNCPQNSANKITRKSSENHQKGKWERQHTASRNHAESSIHTMKVHTRSSLPPGYPSLSLDLT